MFLNSCSKLFDIFVHVHVLIVFLGYCYYSFTDTTIEPNQIVISFSPASRILKALNKDVDPCTDFYEFACGGWIKQNPVPDWATSWDQLARLREQLVMDLRELLEAKSDEGLPESVIKAKSLYRTCVNTGRHNFDYMFCTLLHFENR